MGIWPKQKTSKVLWKWEFEQMGIFSAWPAKWECCMLAFTWFPLPPHNSLFLNPTGSKMWNAFDKLTFTVNQTIFICLKNWLQDPEEGSKTVHKQWGSVRGWLQSSGTRLYSLIQTCFSPFLLFKLGKFAWKLFLLCGGFICWETCDCASARFGQVTKWESKTENKESTVKMGIRTNGNFGQHFLQQGTKWDPILSRIYCTTTIGLWVIIYFYCSIL